ncbi:hypothetical protein KM043_006791 [Ampulex compressa]|nr:hypothetical protein KM043_006791 [Ampulex compressa]
MSRMRPLQLLVSCALILSSSPLVCCQSPGRVTFEEGPSEGRSTQHGNQAEVVYDHKGVNRTREGKGILDWIGLGLGQNVDPYMAKVNQACLNGDLAECFKSRALDYFSDFFDQAQYSMSDHVRVVRMSKNVLKEVDRQPYEFSGESRSDESEWDQLVKFALRKAERFVKTMAFEISVPSSETGQNEAYAPRFLDEIADEIDTLEHKKDTLFSRLQFRKLLLPMLIVLKLFKLKLLLFLPLIFGLASFKKFLGFLAIVIPGLIGFFKIYKPLTQNYQPPVYSQSGIGYPYYKENAGHFVENAPEYHGGYHGDGVSFGQDIAYRGYREYQS